MRRNQSHKKGLLFLRRILLYNKTMNSKTLDILVLILVVFALVAGIYFALYVEPQSKDAVQKSLAHFMV